MQKWNDSPIIARIDGSYEITRNGLPYHVPNEGEYADLYAEVVAYAAAHPQQVKQENPPVAPSLEDIVNQYMNLVQIRLDTFARTKTYDGMLSACTYATSADPTFSKEGQYCVEARDATWKAANAVMQDALSKGKTLSWEEVEAKLPALKWPKA